MATSNQRLCELYEYSSNDLAASAVPGLLHAADVYDDTTILVLPVCCSAEFCVQFLAKLQQLAVIYLDLEHHPIPIDSTSSVY
jgi:hypothetical protein